jgi:hypothetical protein
MLSQLVIGYDDGREEIKIVPSNNTKIYPQRDKIKYGFHKPFKYEVIKHRILPVTIANFPNGKVIMPAGIDCHPETTLNDIIEIVVETEKEKQEKKEIKEKNVFEFKSSSSDSIYKVRQNGDKLKCDCPGTWRAKDRRCKHIKEVEKILNIK